MSLTLRTAAAIALAALVAGTPVSAERAATPIPETFAAAGGTAGGQAVAPPAPTTLAQARELALAKSPALRKALLAVDSAVLARRSRSNELLPQLSATAQTGFSFGGSESFLSTFRASLGLSASQTIYDGGRNAALAAIDAIDEATARAGARSAYFAAVKGVEQAWYAALQAYAAEKAARSDLEASRTHLALAEAKLEAGMIARPAYLKSESEVASKETALANATRKSQSAARSLSSLTGLPASASLAEADEAAVEALATRLAALGAAETDDFAAALLAAAEKGNPDLAAAGLALERAKASVASARREAFPKVSASVSHNSSYVEATGFTPSSGSITLGASIAIAPWNVRSAVAEAEKAEEEKAIAAEDSRDSAGLQIAGAVYDAVANARAIASSKKALEYAQRNYEALLEAFKLSSLSSSDLSDAEVLVSSAASSLIAARYGFLSGLSSLKALAGLEEDGLLEAAIP